MLTNYNVGTETIGDLTQGHEDDELILEMFVDAGVSSQLLRQIFRRLPADVGRLDAAFAESVAAEEAAGGGGGDEGDPGSVADGRWLLDDFYIDGDGGWKVRGENYKTREKESSF